MYNKIIDNVSKYVWHAINESIDFDDDDDDETVSSSAIDGYNEEQLDILEKAIRQHCLFDNMHCHTRYSDYNFTIEKNYDTREIDVYMTSDSSLYEKQLVNKLFTVRLDKDGGYTLISYVADNYINFIFGFQLTNILPNIRVIKQMKSTASKQVYIGSKFEKPLYISNFKFAPESLNIESLTFTNKKGVQIPNSKIICGVRQVVADTVESLFNYFYMLDLTGITLKFEEGSITEASTEIIINDYDGHIKKMSNPVLLCASYIEWLYDNHPAMVQKQITNDMWFMDIKYKNTYNSWMEKNGSKLLYRSKNEL